MTELGFEPSRVQLDNGLTVLHQINHASEAVTISLSVAAGAILDPETKRGLATLVARGLIRGTARRSKLEIGERLDFRGAHLVGSGGRHTGGLVAKTRAEDFDVLLELVAESARDPIFPEAEVDKLKGDRLTVLREEEDDPATVVMNCFRELVYGPDHPYGARVLGNPETVASITPADMRSFHARHYGPGAALLVVVGDVELGQVLDAVERDFGRWEAEGPVSGYRTAQVGVPDAPDLPSITRKTDSMPNKSQVDIAVGHASIRRSDPRFHAASLLNMVLGRFAMGGRLGRSVREEQGMAYYTYSALQAGLGPGPFVVRAGVQPQHVDPAIESIVTEIGRICAEPVDVEELDNAKAAAIRSLPRTLESNEGIAGLLHQIELHDLGLDYLERFGALVSAVDADAIRSTARELLHPDAYALAIAGPYDS